MIYSQINRVMLRIQVIVVCLFTTIIVVLFLSDAGLAASRVNKPAEPVILKESMAKEALGLHLEYLEDKNKELTITHLLRGVDAGKNKLKWFPSNKKTLGFGYTSSQYWVRFSVKNPLNKKIDWSLEVDYPHIDYIDVYVPGKKSMAPVKSGGDNVPFKKRDITYRNVIFNFSEDPNSVNHYYIRFKTTSSMNIPLWIWTPSILTKSIINEQILLGIYYGVIIIITLYNLFLFLAIRDLNYLYYILWVCGYGLYQLSVNGLSFQYLWPESMWWGNKCMPFFISFGTTCSFQFGRSFLNTAKTVPVLDKILLVFMGITSINTILAFILPYSIITPLAVFFVIIMVICLQISGSICLYKGYGPARFYVLAWTILFIGVLLFALKAFGVLGENFITNWGQQIGSAIEATFLSLALADRISVINREKKWAQKEAIKAREKYKLIVEGSNDIIFWLDDQWNFITANKAIRTHLNIDPEKVDTMNFLDLIYEDIDDEQGGYIAKQLVQKKLETFSENREPIGFKMEFRPVYSKEPKEMQVSMEYINIEGNDEILGKASRVLEDSLLKYFLYEKQKFAIGNFLITAEEISFRLTRNLQKYVLQKEINSIRIALREIIINAIEHGNLNISYREKTEALMDNNYFSFVSTRQHDPELSRREVYIEYSISPEKVVYKITDEGTGFDHQKMLNEDSEEANEEMLSHGRGLSMAKTVFDVVTFNKKGNKVLLVKNFNNNIDFN
ncbi:MAG: histidine kinase [bacterium]|nr:histidine kinase [bacterium]